MFSPEPDFCFHPLPILDSSLFAGETHSGVVDAKSGCQVSPDTVKMVVWFDNEAGQAARVVDLVARTHLALTTTAEKDLEMKTDNYD